MSRRHNLLRIKRHLSYTAKELADTLSINITTVWRWKREGLVPIEGTWPFLFAPAEILRFLKLKNKPRRSLAPGQFLCVACKEHRIPCHDLVVVLPRSATSVDLVGTCPQCGRRMHRRVALCRFSEALGSLTVRYEDGGAPIISDSEAARTARAGERV